VTGKIKCVQCGTAKRNFKKCEGLAFFIVTSANIKTRSVCLSGRLVDMVCMSSPFLVIVLLCRLFFSIVGNGSSSKNPLSNKYSSQNYPIF
jgi:hypothetical protein